MKFTDEIAGSGSVSQRSGWYQNVTDPQHWSVVWFGHISQLLRGGVRLFFVSQCWYYLPAAVPVSSVCVCVCRCERSPSAMTACCWRAPARTWRSTLATWTLRRRWPRYQWTRPPSPSPGIHLGQVTLMPSLQTSTSWHQCEHSV